jgi:hypothetical protein
MNRYGDIRHTVSYNYHAESDDGPVGVPPRYNYLEIVHKFLGISKRTWREGNRERKTPKYYTSFRQLWLLNVGERFSTDRDADQRHF